MLIGDTLAKAVFDSVADQVKAMVGVYGRDSGDSGTIAAGANSQIQKIQAEFDTNPELARDLAGAILDYAKVAKMTPQPASALVDKVLRPLERHVQEEGGFDDINDYLSSSKDSHGAFKVHPYVREIWPQVAAKNVWPLSMDTTTGHVDAGNEQSALYSYESGGSGSAGAGAAIGDDVDTTKYGDCLLQGYVPSGKSLTISGEITIAGVDGNGNGVTLTFTTPAVTGPNKFSITGSTRFAKVTSVTEDNTALASGDWFDLIPKDDRAPTLVIP